MIRKPMKVAALAAAAMLALTACSSGTANESNPTAAPEAVKTLRLGFFPNLTHAPALVGQQGGFFKNALKDLGVTVTPTAFNAGPDAVTSLFGGSLDISYIGPNPTINAYAESQGSAIRVIAGAASGGAALIVKPEIKSISDLKGKTLATPQIGNTQDVALRHLLKENGLSTDTQGGGDVKIAPQANGEGLTAYTTGNIDGAWVPEPWVSEYLKAGAHILVDEKTLWPDGKFVTTNIVVRTQFLNDHPDVVEAFLNGHVAALQEIAEHPKEAAEAANASLKALTGSSLAADVLDRAFGEVDFTADPLPATLKTSADHAVEVGLLDSAKLDAAGGLPGTLYSLDLLNKVLTSAKLPTVAQP